VLATLTKTAGVRANNSHSDTRRSSVVTCTQLLSYHTVAHSFAFTQNSTRFFSSGSALFAKNHPRGGMGINEEKERFLTCVRNDEQGMHGKPRHYRGEGNGALKGASTERRRERKDTEDTMFRQLPGISDIVPLQRRKETKQIRPGGSEDRGRWLSSGPGSFRRSSSLSRWFSRR